MISTRTRVIIEIAATVVLLAFTSYTVGVSALVAPWALAVGCVTFIAFMWYEAWKLRANRRASAVIVDLAMGAAGMFALLALQVSRLAEQLSACVP
jgi:hypothetical protein